MIRAFIQRLLSLLSPYRVPEAWEGVVALNIMKATEGQ